MNFLKSLALIGCVSMALNVVAGNVGISEARTKALQFINNRPGMLLKAPSGDLKLAHVEKSVANSQIADYYVFNAEDGSAFVIVAGDDRATEVLAYGPQALDMEKVPCNMKWMLDQYKKQMSFLHQHPEVIKSTPNRSATVKVSPLLSCEWNQRAPYYNQCPTSGTQHCLTGCVATAMAQVMYYWKYPAEAPAMDAYVSEINNFAVGSLPGGTFDWDNMLDTYTNSASTQEKDAVAMLMRYCGQACHMAYGTSGSGAYSDDELEGMKLFGYNPDAELISRDDYTAEEWMQMIEEQLAAGCPILYGGVDASHDAGHAWVVDGCSDGMYHVNWGWSGAGDGFFALDAFTYATMIYSSGQEMLYQVYPMGYMYDKHAAVMEPAANVNATSFTADWTDLTPSDMVTDYTLYVQPYEPEAHEVLLNETFAAVDVNIDATTAIATNKIGTYCDNPGWTGTFIYLGAGGCFIVGGQKYVGSLNTPPLNVGEDGVITVKFNSRYFGSDNSTALVSCGDTQVSIELTRVATDYVVVFENVEPGAVVNFACTGRAQRFYLDDVVITTGDDRNPIEMGGSLVFPGLTDTDYTVTGLTTGGTYRYLVVTNFADGTTMKSNMEVVTLTDAPAHDYERGDVNHDHQVSIADVSALIDYLLDETSPACLICADMNGNSEVTIADVSALIDYLLDN